MRIFESPVYFQRGRGAAAYGAAYGPSFGRVYGPNFDWNYQRGRGIGSLFSKIFTSVVPLVKGAFKIGKKAVTSNTAKALGRELKRSATQAGLNVVSDALQGKNVVESSKEQLSKAGDRLAEKVAKLAVDPPVKQRARTAASRRKPRRPRKVRGRGAGKKRRGKSGKKSRRRKKPGSKGKKSRKRARRRKDIFS